MHVLCSLMQGGHFPCAAYSLDSNQLHGDLGFSVECFDECAELFMLGHQKNKLCMDKSEIMAN